MNRLFSALLGSERMRPSPSLVCSASDPNYCLVHQPTKFRHPTLRLRVNIEPRPSSGSPAEEEVPGVAKLPFRDGGIHI